jgi:hypothetical protein
MSETDKLEQSEKMKKRAGELVKVRFHIELEKSLPKLSLFFIFK